MCTALPFGTKPWAAQTARSCDKDIVCKLEGRLDALIGILPCAAQEGPGPSDVVPEATPECFGFLPLLEKAFSS